MKRLFSLLTIVSCTLLMGAGCTFQLGAARDGGIFRSIDGGNVWQQLTIATLLTGQKSSLANATITKFVIDPRNANVMFAGTAGLGLFASENGGESWQQLIAGQTIIDMATDNDSRCIFYAQTATQVFKTTDCARTWRVTYKETRTASKITSIAVDPLTPEVLYITTSLGDLFKSVDRGNTWTVLYRLDGKSLNKVLIDRYDSNLLYIASDKTGIFRSRNKGISWESISAPIEKVPSALEFNFLANMSQREGILYASAGAFFVSYNAGSTWQQIPLLTPVNTAIIRAAASNPINDQELYYATVSTFYHSVDNGKSWIAHPLPTQKSASSIAIDPYNTQRIFLGTQVLAQSSPFFYYKN